MNNRIINLIGHLGKADCDTAEMKEIFRVVTPEIQKLEDTNSQIVKNRYITTCDEHGISVFEKHMKLYPNPGDSLDVRRMRALIKWQDRIPINYATLKAFCESVVGEGNCVVDIDDLHVTITAGTQYYDLINALHDEIREMIPCHIGLDINIATNTHGDLEALTHLYLSSYTHEQVATNTELS